jgi:hypothetical protein
LRGKSIYCLGSFLTQGGYSEGIAYPDYLFALAEKKGQKVLVEGGEPFRIGSGSYLEALEKNPPRKNTDIVLIQFSDDDLFSELDFAPDSSKDPRTLSGYLSSLVEKVRSRSSAKLYFLVFPYPENADYLERILLLKRLGHALHFEVIDLRDDPLFSKRKNSLSDDFVDGIHPTKKGYQNLILPCLLDKLCPKDEASESPEKRNLETSPDKDLLKGDDDQSSFAQEGHVFEERMETRYPH